MRPSLPPSPDPAHEHLMSPQATLVIVRLRAAAGVTMEDMRDVAERVRESFVGMPGLRRKYFSYSPERREVVNVYVWRDRAAAALVSDPGFVAKIRAVYAGEPEITVAEVLAIAE
ncbi:MAG TPA: hypothetical protein VHE11_14100 [Steroidobacteraceae bacterium]|nr:hypothetical protein [Steroidobacteraceae bacterium]